MGSRNVTRVVEDIITILKSDVDSPERRRAVEEIVEMAMKADTLDLLDSKGYVPEELRYPTPDLEGETTNG